jgi:hypothetical protein
MSEPSFRNKVAPPRRLAEDLRKQPQTPRATEDNGTEETESSSHLGVGRDRKVRLELRLKDGSVKAINYADFVLIDYDPERGITLEMPPHFRVCLKGVALAPLLKGLAAERVAYVREADEFAASARQDNKPVVVSICFEKWPG